MLSLRFPPMWVTIDDTSESRDVGPTGEGGRVDIFGYIEYPLSITITDFYIRDFSIFPL